MTKPDRGRRPDQHERDDQDALQRPDRRADPRRRPLARPAAAGLGAGGRRAVPRRPRWGARLTVATTARPAPCSRRRRRRGATAGLAAGRGVGQVARRDQREHEVVRAAGVDEEQRHQHDAGQHHRVDVARSQSRRIGFTRSTHTAAERHALEDHQPADDRDRHVERLVGEEQHPRPRGPRAARARTPAPSPVRSMPARAAASSALRSARRVAWTFQRSTSMWVTTTITTYTSAGQPEREHGGDEAQPDVERRGHQRRPAVRPPVPLLRAIQSFWSTKSATRCANTSHARTQDACRSRGAPGPGGGARRARRPRRGRAVGNSVARLGASRPRWRTWPRSAMTETVARLTRSRSAASASRSSSTSDQPPDLALAGGELVEQRGQERPEVARAGRPPRHRRCGDHPLAAAPSRARQPRARRGRRARCAPSRGRCRARRPGDDRPAQLAGIRDGGRRGATAGNGSAPGASRSWSSSPWVNPAARGARPRTPRPARRAASAGTRTHPGRAASRRRRRTARSPGQERSSRGSLPQAQLDRKRLTSYQVAVSG